jgi:WD40 repeat protein/serine/threonine protein kinase
LDSEFYQKSCELFSRACELSPDEQLAFLLIVCPDDAQLRSQVEQMLLEDRNPGGVQPAESGSHHQSASEPFQTAVGFLTDPNHLSIGKSVAFPAIAGFTIVHKIGEGGNGIVYRAVQHSTNRPVALKTLWFREFSSEKHRRRFDREVELAASIEHPNIAHVYDSGESNGIPWLAMELIDGIALDVYLKTHSIEIRDKLKLMSTICDAVGYAHRRGIIHRDLKPANILVTENGTPFVVDFGLARMLEKDLDSGNTLSMAGELLGTPGFMSPEQARGDAQSTDIRSDCYSLGSILFWVLTGHSPHDLSGSPLTMMRRIAEEEARSPKSLGVSLDRDLTALLSKGVSIDPANRYQTADELAQDLRRYLNHEPLLARSRSTRYLIGKWVVRHRLLVATSFSLLLVAVAAVFGYFKSMQIEQAKTLAAQKDSQRRADQLRQLMFQTTLTRGQELCESNELSRGLEQMREAIHYLDNDQPELQRAIHSNLAAWEQEEWSPKGKLRIGSTARNLQFSPDGTRLATIGMRSASLWDVETQEQVGPPLAHVIGPYQFRMWSIEFSPDGSQVLTSASDGRAIIWDANTGMRTGIVFHHAGVAGFSSKETDVWEAHFSPDGSKVLTAGGDGFVRIWDAATGTPLGAPLSHDKSPVQSAKFDPTGGWIVTGARDGLVRFWDLQTRELIGQPLETNRSQWIHTVKVSPDGRLVFAISHDGRIRIWDTKKREMLTETVPDNREIVGAEFNPHDGFLYVLTTKGEVQPWDVRTLPAAHRSVTIPGDVTCITVDDQGRHVAVGDREGTIRVHTIPQSQNLRQGIYLGSPVNAIALSSNASTVWIATESQSLYAWDITQHPPRKTLEQYLLPDNPLAMAATPDGTSLLVGVGGGVRTFDIKTRRLGQEPPRPPKGDNEMTSAIAITSDGGQYATGARSGAVRLWTKTGELLWSMHCGGAVNSLRFTPDGSRLLAASLDGNAWIWSIANPADNVVKVEHPDAVLAVDVSREGFRLLTGCRDGMVRTWDLANQLHLLTQIDQRQPVTSVAFYPVETGRASWILTGCRDGSVRTWDNDTRFQIGPTFRHTATVRSLTLLDGGSTLMTASIDRSVRFWTLPKSINDDLRK